MNNNGQFLPETVDEQIEDSLVHGESNLPTQQTVQELQKLLAPQPQGEALDRVWTRLVHARASSSSIEEHITSQERPFLVSRILHGKSKQVSQVAPYSQSSRMSRALTLIAAVIFLTLLVGSMAMVFQLASKRHNPNNGVAGQPPQSTFQPAKGTLFALSGRTAYALNGVTHEVLWEHQLPMPTHTWNGKLDFSYNPITVTNGIYYVWWADDAIYALNTKDGSLLWKYQTTERGGDLLVDSRGAYIVESTGNHQYNMIKALGATTGKILWQKTLKGKSDTFNAAVVNVSHNVLYVSGTDDVNFNVYAFNTRDGSQLWERGQSNVLFNETGAYVDEGTFYISTLDGNLGNNTSDIFAYNAMTGQPKWHKRYDGHDTRLSVASNGMLYMTAISNENNMPHTSDFIYGPDSIEALSEHDGSLLWTYTALPPNGVSDPTVANGSVYVTLVNEPKNSGSVVALDTQTGKVSWAQTLTKKPGYDLPAVPAENTVAVGMADGEIDISQNLGKTINSTLLDEKLPQQNMVFADVAINQ